MRRLTCFFCEEDVAVKKCPCGLGMGRWLEDVVVSSSRGVV